MDKDQKYKRIKDHMEKKMQERQNTVVIGDSKFGLTGDDLRREKLELLSKEQLIQMVL